MNKKRILLVLSLICLLFLMTGCVKTDANGNIRYIYSYTTFAEVKNDGFISALLIYPLAQAINFLEPIVGIVPALMIVTVVLNGLVLAITFKSNVGMQKMQALQPELTKIQKKYEGRTDQASQQRQAQEMNNLYQKNGVNPLGSLAATFIQFPLLIAMYSAVRQSAAVVNSSFLGFSLSLTPKQAFSQKAWVLLVIYVMMIAAQFLSIKFPQMLAERKAKKEADLHHRHYEKAPNNQNALMTYGMLIMIAFIMLSWPTALSLYYCISSLVAILKTVLINRLVEKELKS